MVSCPFEIRQGAVTPAAECTLAVAPDLRVAHAREVSLLIGAGGSTRMVNEGGGSEWGGYDGHRSS